VIVVVSCIALLTQGLIFHDLERELRDDLMAHPGVFSPKDLAWTQRTPLQGWHLPINALLVQGRNPVSLVVPNPDPDQLLYLPSDNLVLSPSEDPDMVKTLFPSVPPRYFHFGAVRAFVVELRRSTKFVAAAQ